MAESFTMAEWALAVLGAMCCGISKAGLAGLGLLNVLIMASLIPGQASSGVVLPLLIGADIMAARKYRTAVQWPLILKVGVPMLVGVVVATFFMWQTRAKPDAFFSHIVGWLVLSLCVLQLIRQQWPALDARLPQSTLFAWCVGLLGGVATMLANAAGPISTLYLLIVGLGKKEFVHTMAWWFLILNLLKVPFMVALGLIGPGSLWLNVALFPAVAVGFWLGGRLLERVPQQLFNQLALALALFFAVNLLLK
jgi:uncharacterized protein